MFYRLSPSKAMRLSGPEFMALAWRTFAYAGVMAARVQAEQDEEEPDTIEVAPTREAISADPALAGLVSWGQG